MGKEFTKTHWGLMNNFFDVDDPLIFTKDFRRKDVLLIPHLYDYKWARELSTFLGRVFASYTPLNFGSWEKSRKFQKVYLDSFLGSIKLGKYKKVFFTNIVDFDFDVMSQFKDIEFYGFVHGSSFLDTEPSVRKLSSGELKENQEKEIRNANMFTRIFSATHWFDNILPYETKVIGLPVFQQMWTPRNSDWILYNHRLDKSKNPEYADKLPDDLRQKILFSLPFTLPSGYGSHFPTKYGSRYIDTKNNETLYQQNLLRCGFGVSFAEHDTFGYSIFEGIYAGLCYFCPINDKTCYQEYMIDELLYNDLDELCDKLRYYMTHEKEKIEIVEKQQRIVNQMYSPENWLQKLIGETDG